MSDLASPCVTLNTSLMRVTRLGEKQQLPKSDNLLSGKPVISVSLKKRAKFGSDSYAYQKMV